jgi:hypothetical protein
VSGRAGVGAVPVQQKRIVGTNVFFAASGTCLLCSSFALHIFPLLLSFHCNLPHISTQQILKLMSRSMQTVPMVPCSLVMPVCVLEPCLRCTVRACQLYCKSASEDIVVKRDRLYTDYELLWSPDRCPFDAHAYYCHGLSTVQYHDIYRTPTTTLTLNPSLFSLPHSVPSVHKSVNTYVVHVVDCLHFYHPFHY